jgi:hypothetical protein
MTRLQTVLLLCGALGVALAWALFSRYAWKARALYLYDVLSGRQQDPNSEAGFTGAAERRSVPRLLKKPAAGAAPSARVDAPDNGSRPQKTG